MIDPCKLTIGSRLKHEGNYCKVICLEEKELVDGTTDVDITCKYLDNTKVVKGFSDYYTTPHDRTAGSSKKKK